MTRTDKRLLVNLVGSKLTSENLKNWSRLNAAGLVDLRPFVGEAFYVIRTAEGDALARQLKFDDSSLIC